MINATLHFHNTQSHKLATAIRRVINYVIQIPGSFCSHYQALTLFFCAISVYIILFICFNSLFLLSSNTITTIEYTYTLLNIQVGHPHNHC